MSLPVGVAVVWLLLLFQCAVMFWLLVLRVVICRLFCVVCSWLLCGCLQLVVKPVLSDVVCHYCCVFVCVRLSRSRARLFDDVRCLLPVARRVLLLLVGRFGMLLVACGLLPLVRRVGFCLLFVVWRLSCAARCCLFFWCCPLSCVVGRSLSVFFCCFVPVVVCSCLLSAVGGRLLFLVVCWLLLVVAVGC